MTALNIASGAYDVGSKPLSAQECINLYPEFLEGEGRSQIALRGTPGLKTWTTVGTGPIYAMTLMNGMLYVVSGTNLYSVDSFGVAESLGETGGGRNAGNNTRRVSMAFNNNFELIIVDGELGWTYDIINGLRAITSENFPGGDVVTALDGYFIVNNPDTQEFWISNPDDGQTWTGTDFASKEGAPGNLIAPWANHRDLMLFGEDTIEFWRNTGGSDFPFARQEGTFQERGCPAAHSIVSLDNTVYFLGDDRMVYKMDGLTPTRISNHGIEKALEGYSTGELQSAKGFAHTYRGHYFYALTVANDTWVYDATFSSQSGKHTWHQRRSGIGDNKPWRANSYEYAYGKHLVGDRDLGCIFELDEDTYTDGGDEIQRVRTLPPMSLETYPTSIPKLELRAETGVGNSDVEDPQIWLEVSRDGGRTWGARQERSLGKIGEYEKQLVWRRQGRSRDWVFRWTMTDKAKCTWFEAYVDPEVGRG